MKNTIEILQGFIDEFKESFDGKEDKLDSLLSAKLDVLVGEYLYELQECNSPIERLYATELISFLPTAHSNLKIDYLDWNAQHGISFKDREGKDKTYILDFAIFVADQEGKFSLQFAIECDGHEYHQKSKQQVAKDKERERWILKHGYTVIRFTGTEIYNDVYKCVKETFEIITAHINQAKSWM